MQITTEEAVRAILINIGENPNREGLKDTPKRVEKYIKFIKQHKNLFSSYVELDIDDVVGYEKVNDWYQNMKEDGLNPIRVWHKERKKQGWEDMCNNCEYIGLTSMNDKLTNESITKMVNYAKGKGVKVHGFACTSYKMLNFIPFYSADSTNWLSGGRFGSFYNQKGDKLISLTPRRFKEDYGKDFSKRNYKLNHLWNALKWKRYSEELEAKNIWNTS